ncbi:hypothetical protein V492_06750 [Pseudogymnoascus sp. VKM F-4246]|nr:hypothetical protein V492_06750 [Pseudogymnoascus sp. VKM F-4246]
MKSLALLPVLIIASSAQTVQLPTWPSPIYDEMEELMTQYDGYRKTGFVDGVIFCGFSPNHEPGVMAAAEWVRTGFHDMATANIATGIGGLDASIIFETDRPENPGSAFNSSFGFFSSFMTARASMADLIALGVQVATRMCHGPLVPYRAGRIDAQAAGPLGVPEPQESLANFTQKFARSGFSAEEMIGLVACGHTLGGVHIKDFPEIVPNGSQPDTTGHFDETRTEFDNFIVTEYLENNSSNPLVVGPMETNSDQKIFASDGNVTMRGLADSDTFAARCATLFAKMIDTVPKEVQLTPVIVPYEIKPKEVRLTVADSTTLNFAGDIRVRTTVRPASNISMVEIVSKRIDNTTQTSLGTRQILDDGTSFSRDDTFTWYSFSTNVSSSSPIESYAIKVTLTNGTVETHDNNGRSFPVPHLLFFQPSASCRGERGNSSAPIDSTVVAAVHQSLLSRSDNPIVRVTARKARAATPRVPELVERDVGMERWVGDEVPEIPKEYAWFRATYPLDPMAFDFQSFDIISPDDGERDVVMDDFRKLPFDTRVCGKIL